MWDLKRKCKKRVYQEGSIFEAYLDDEMATFCSFYFEDGAHTSLPRPATVEMRNLRGTMGCLRIFFHIPTFDEMATICSFYFEDGAHTALPRPQTVEMGNLRGTMVCLPIFSHPGINVEKYNEYKRIKQIEFHIVHNYVLINCQDVIRYIQQFEQLARVKYPHISEPTLSKYWDREFARWFHQIVSYSLSIKLNIYLRINDHNKLINENMLFSSPFIRLSTWTSHLWISECTGFCLNRLGMLDKSKATI